MLFKKTPTEPTPLDVAIEDIFSELRGLNSDDEEYSAAADQLVKLMKLKQELDPAFRISPDVMVTAGVNLLGILLILHYEKLNVVTSKAIGFVTKLR